MPQLGQGDDADHQRTHARSLHRHREDAPVSSNPPAEPQDHHPAGLCPCSQGRRLARCGRQRENQDPQTRCPDHGPRGHGWTSASFADGDEQSQYQQTQSQHRQEGLTIPSRRHEQESENPHRRPQGDAEAGYYDHTLKGRHGPRLPLTNTSGARSFFPLNLLPRLYQEPLVIARVNRKEFTAKLKPEEIDFKRLDVLARFLTPIGKIEPARRTGATRTQQARIVRAIKRARYLGLLPYTINDSR